MELSFLKGLPALLGFVGFFVYLWRGQATIGSETTKLIVGKLQNDPNLPLEKLDTTMSAAKLKHLVDTDERFRGRVNDAHMKLLGQMVRWQNIVTLVVFLACVALVVFAAVLYSRPSPLEVTLSPPQALATKNGKPLLDLDQLAVDWSAKGVGEQFRVSLENVDTNTKTTPQTVASDVGRVIFDPVDLKAVATNRAYGGRNRIRAVVETASNSFKSAIVDLGVQVRLYADLNGGSAMLFPVIGGSGENIPPGFCFNASLVGFRSGSEFEEVKLGKRCKNDIKLNPALIQGFNWSRPITFLYKGPMPDIVRTCLYGPLGLTEKDDYSCRPGQVEE